MSGQYLFAIINLAITAAGIFFAVGKFSAKVHELEKNRDDYRKSLEDKLSEHRITDDKQFSKYDNWHKDHFERIGKLENNQAAQTERNLNNDKRHDEVKSDIGDIKKELAEIKNLILKLYEKS